MSRKTEPATAAPTAPATVTVPPRPTQAGSWMLEGDTWVCLEGPHLKQSEAAPADLSPEQEV